MREGTWDWDLILVMIGTSNIWTSNIFTNIKY